MTISKPVVVWGQRWGRKEILGVMDMFQNFIVMVVAQLCVHLLKCIKLYASDG